MKILKVYPFPDVKAGTEISMHLGAAALQEKGHEVYLLHGMPDLPETARSYQGTISLPEIFDRNSKIAPSGFLAALKQSENYCRQNRIDLIHVHGYPRTAAIRRFSRIRPTVASVHVPLCPNGARYHWTQREVCNREIGLGCLTVGYRTCGCGHLGNSLPVALPGFLRGIADNHLLRDALISCSGVIANSFWMRERLLKDAFPAETLHVVHAPIVVGQDEGERVPETPPAIAFIGRLVDFKGPDHLLTASSQIAAEHRVWFIGGGVMQSKLEQQAIEMGISGRVTFFGKMPPDEITEYRRRSAIVVVPSLWPEPFGMVGPEAMLMRRPVVAYKVGGIPEWLEDGLTGRLVEPGNTNQLAQVLAELLVSPEQRRTLGNAGAAAAVQWKPERHAEKLLDVYQKVLLTNGSNAQH